MGRSLQPPFVNLTLTWAARLAAAFPPQERPVDARPTAFAYAGNSLVLAMNLRWHSHDSALTFILIAIVLSVASFFVSAWALRRNRGHLATAAILGGIVVGAILVVFALRQSSLANALATANLVLGLTLTLTGLALTFRTPTPDAKASNR